MRSKRPVARHSDVETRESRVSTLVSHWWNSLQSAQLSGREREMTTAGLKARQHKAQAFTPVCKWQLMAA